MNIYFVRHGKTEFNQENRIQGGKIDSPLLPEGIAGAKAVGEKLQGIHFDKVYVSPLKRTVDTANYLLSKNKYQNETLIIEEIAFREIEFGDWEGKYIEDIKSDIEYPHLRNSPEKYNPTKFNGESYPELVKRASDTLQELQKTHKAAENILIVSHGVVITSLIKHLTGKPISKYREDGIVDNTSVSVLDYSNERDEYKIIQYNG